MIHADLQHHTHSAEDRFTSNCLGLLRLLPDSDFIDFFSTAVKLDNTPIDLSHYEHVSTIEFWPWLPPAGFPDVIAQLQNKNGTARVALIIEVKHGASKSGAPGGANADEPSESPEVTAGDRRYGDQLAKYWQAGCQRFRRPAVLYLTHDRWLPKEDLEASVGEAGTAADIFWLSWFALYRWASNQLTMSTARPTAEVRILQTPPRLPRSERVSLFSWMVFASSARHVSGPGQPPLCCHCTSRSSSRRLLCAYLRARPDDDTDEPTPFLSSPSGGAMSQAIVTTLKTVDAFHKNCEFLFVTLRLRSGKTRLPRLLRTSDSLPKNGPSIRSWIAYAQGGIVFKRT